MHVWALHSSHRHLTHEHPWHRLTCGVPLVDIIKHLDLEELRTSTPQRFFDTPANDFNATKSKPNMRSPGRVVHKSSTVGVWRPPDANDIAHHARGLRGSCNDIFLSVE